MSCGKQPPLHHPTLPRSDFVKLNWNLPVKFVYECGVCPDCHEAWCGECMEHYADCAHPGPHSEPDEDNPKIFPPDGKRERDVEEACDKYRKKFL